MSATEAARLATWAASRAHVAKNAFQADAGLMNLAAAVERLAQAVAELADHSVSERTEGDAASGEVADIEESGASAAASTGNGTKPVEPDIAAQPED